MFGSFFKKKAEDQTESKNDNSGDKKEVKLV
jgi:hypothetical protein